jgi:hypothetical protein
VNPDELLTTTAAGAILGKSGRTVARLVEAGRLRAAQRLPGPKGALLLRRADVEAFAAEIAVKLCPTCGQHLPRSRGEAA